MHKININPPPNYPKPKAPPAPPKVDSGYGGMTNAEVYGALALILIELQKINERLDAMGKEDVVAIPTPKDWPKVCLNEHEPDLMYREDKNISL